MSTLRKVLLYIFAAVYIGAASLTVLYALGFIFNPEEQTLRQTGLVSLGSEPPGAEVWIDGLPSRDKTPVVLRNLKPGAHEIRLSFPGHHSWQKGLEVIAERALRFENILLFPVSLTPEILTPFPISNFWRAPSGRYLLTLTGQTAAGLHLLELPGRKIIPIGPLFPIPEARVVDALFHPEFDQAILFLQKGGESIPFLIKFSDPLEITPLSSLLPLKNRGQVTGSTGNLSPVFEKIQWDRPFSGAVPFLEKKYYGWDRRQKNLLFYLQEGNLHKVNLERNRIWAPLAEKVAGFALHKGKLYILDREKRVLVLNEKGKSEEVLLGDSAKARLIFGPGPPENYEISFLSNPFVFSLQDEVVALFLSREGRFLSNRLPYFLDENVEGLIPAHSHLRAAYHKGKELWGVDFERREAKSFFELGPAPRQIYKGKEPLSHILWTYNDQYLVFLEGDHVRVQDFEGGEEAELLKVSKDVREIILDPHTGFLYYAHPDHDRLARAKLHAPPGLLPRIVDDFVEAATNSPSREGSAPR